MKLNNDNDILTLIRQDEWMMDIIKAAKTLKLPDWWVCAGFIRSKIWDALSGFTERTPIPDIDVIYFDSQNIDESVEKKLEENLRKVLPNVPWSVKNEARMHIANNLPPYTSSYDAISKFPETATALGVMLDNSDNLILAAPHGIDDVINLEIKPTDYFAESKKRMAIYRERIIKKQWKLIWNGIKVHDVDCLHATK